MIERMNGKQQRALAVALLVLLVLALLAMTVTPVWSANASRQARLDQLQELLTRYESIAARDQSLVPQYTALRKTQMSSGNYLKSTTVAMAGAELQRRAKGIATAHQAQVVSTQILPASDEEGFTRIAIKVRLRGPLPSILNAFYAIETDSVFMFLDNVSMRDNAAGRRPVKTQIMPMDAEFDLIAYMPGAS